MNSKSATRRSFLTSAGSALAVAAAGPALRATEKRPLFRAAELNHLSLDITQFERSETFYRSVFGFTPITHGGRGGDKFLHFAQGFLNMRPADQAGMNHFCFSIENFDADFTFQMLDFAQTRPFRMGGRNTHCFDPDELNVQIQEERHGWGRIRENQLTNHDQGLFTTVRIHHVSLNVTDIDQSRQFYREMFGLVPIDVANKGDSCVLQVGESAYLELHQAEEAGIHHCCFGVRDFDPNNLPTELKKWSKTAPKQVEMDVVRISDPQGIAIEITSADRQWPASKPT